MKGRGGGGNAFGTILCRCRSMKAQTGVRVDRNVLPVFKDLCKAEGFGVGEAIEGFMKACVETKSVQLVIHGIAQVTDAQRTADLTRLKAEMSDLSSLVETSRQELKETHHSVYHAGMVKEIAERVLRVVSRVDNKELVAESSKLIEDAYDYVREERTLNVQRNLPWAH